MKAYEVIDTPEKWCQNSVAKDRHGLAASANDSNAVSFCIYGALHRAYVGVDGAGNEYHPHAERIRKEIAPLTISQFNDNPRRKHEEVISLLKRLDI